MLVTGFESYLIRAFVIGSRDMNRLSMERLDAETKHRPVNLLKNIGADLGDIVRPYPHYLMIKRSVVNLAHCQTIRDHRLATIGIRNDVGCVEKVDMPKRADATLAPIGTEDGRSKSGLLSSTLDQSQVMTSWPYHVELSQFSWSAQGRRLDREEGKIEGQGLRMIFHYRCTPHVVETAGNPVQVNQRDRVLHGDSKKVVLDVIPIAAAISVLEKPILRDLVRIGPLTVTTRRGGSNRDGKLKNGRFEDSLLTRQGNPSTFKKEVL